MLTLNDIQALLFVMEPSLTGVALIVLAHACTFSLTVGLRYGRNRVLKAVQRTNRSVKEELRLCSHLMNMTGQLSVRHGLFHQVLTRDGQMKDKRCVFQFFKFLS